MPSWWQRAADTVLDRTLIGGYTSIGYGIRQQWWEQDDPRPRALEGAVALVTGGNSGMGAATVEQLVTLGARVLLVARTRERSEKVAADLRERHPGAQIDVLVADIGDLDQIGDLAAEVKLRTDRLDVLVHNAGALPSSRSESAQGHETTFAVHVLGPVLLTELLRPMLSATPRARVIFVSSGGMYTAGLHLDDLEYRQGEYRGAMAYARTKRMQVELTPVLAARYAADGIAVHALHPGWADTPGVTGSLPGFNKVMGPLLRTADQAVDTTVWLAATDQDLPTGKFWHDRRPRPTVLVPGTGSSPDEIMQLWRQVRVAAQLDDLAEHGQETEKPHGTKSTGRPENTDSNEVSA